MIAKKIIFLLLITFCFSCSIRHDGAMSMDNTVIKMIYFKTKDNDRFIQQMDTYFGNHSKGKRDFEYHWKKIEMKEWSDKTIDIKAMNYLGKISIAIVDDANVTLTEKNHANFSKVKSFFKKLKKSIN